MLLSIHLQPARPRAAFQLLRAQPDPSAVDGLTWARTAAAFPLAESPPKVDGVALLAAWRDAAALDAFLAEDPLAERFARGWSARLQPLRAYGEISGLPGLGRPEQPVADDEPVAVLTLGRLRVRRAVAFARASAPAERQAREHPAVVLSTALARPPRLVATFSVWRTAAEMRAYAVGAHDGNRHTAAMRVHAAKPFHHEAVFARFRPSAATGAFRGAAPLATAAASP